MHVHLLNEAWNIVQPPDDPSQATDLDLDSFLFLYLANGVTTVQVYLPIAAEQRQGIRVGFEQFQLPFTKTLHDRGAIVEPSKSAFRPVSADPRLTSR